ncbi:hypothetical protein [Yersinia aleksiciae]|uniref:Uncharacterized protein n=1 Tax=Yersinia aleksiciae TaxID=263819 RepID=A0ABM5UCI7_YERAE|nr:hypothetical protein [Yersinia aleksiciae]AKP33516.1 hypothetical protein ACZ76_08190 [Yersinia aleksiciae]CFQ40425.1 NADH dehydrogenase subunit 5 [Yersinia aleksiciae]
MGDITTAGYFANHQLSESDFCSLQAKPEEFKPKLTPYEAIADFLRMIFCCEMKRSALVNLNYFMHENYLTNNPIEILTVFEKILPDEIKEKVFYSIHYEGSESKLKSIVIQYNEKSIEISPNHCWLTDSDKEIIKKLKSNVIIFHTGNSDIINADEVNETEGKENSNSKRENFIKNALNRGVNELSSEKKCVNLIYDIDSKDCVVERVVLINNGLPYLEIPLKSGENIIIQNSLSERIAIENTYTSSPYKKITRELRSLDEKLAYLDDDQSPATPRLIDEVAKIIVELKELIQFNDIVRAIDIDIQSKKCKYYISKALDAINNIKDNKLSRNDFNLEVLEIKNNIMFFKNNISTENYHDPHNPEQTITYAERAIRITEKKIKDWQDRLGLIDVNSTVSTMTEFVKYCAEYLNVKTPKVHTKNIVDVQALDDLERQNAMNAAFNNLYNFASNDEENSKLISINKIEEFLLEYQGNNLINKGNQDISKFSDELYGFNPNLFIPRDLLNEYSAANKTLTEEIKSSLNLSLHNSEEFRAKAMGLLSKVHVMKSLFLDKYMKCFDAQRMSESQDMLTVFKTILNRIEQNKTIDEDKKHTWLLQANKRLLDEINRKIGASATIPE